MMLTEIAVTLAEKHTLQPTLAVQVDGEWLKRVEVVSNFNGVVRWKLRPIMCVASPCHKKKSLG
jgi:hypothetical protein